MSFQKLFLSVTPVLIVIGLAMSGDYICALPFVMLSVILFVMTDSKG